MFFTSILLTILSSNFWLRFILIFYFHDSDYGIIFEIQIIILIFILIITPSHPVTSSVYFYLHNGTVSPAPSFIVVLCRFYIMVTYRMIATTHFDRQFHQCYFELTYYSIFFSERWFFITVDIVNYFFLVIITYPMITNIRLITDLIWRMFR